MSIRNQLRVATNLLAAVTAASVAKEVREILNTLDQPEMQNQPVITDVSGRWLTVAECREYFGPEFKSNHVFIQQCIAAYLGRFTKAAIEQVGLDVRACTHQQLAELMLVTDKAEKAAFVRLTAN